MIFQEALKLIAANYDLDEYIAKQLELTLQLLQADRKKLNKLDYC
jgi:hypothetical protein